jgi:hypothetical protein
MEESLLNKAFRLAPMSIAASIAYGLEHAPTFTISLLNGVLFAAATEYHSRIEDREFAHQLYDPMSGCGRGSTGRRQRAIAEHRWSGFPQGRWRRR